MPRINGIIPALVVIAALALGNWPRILSFPINAVTGPLFFGVVGVVLILSALGPASRWLDNAALTWCGRRSYALYLWHFPLVWAVLRGPVHILGGRRDALLALIVSCLLAEASWWLIERPAATLRARLHGKPAARPAVPDLGPGST